MKGKRYSPVEVNVDDQQEGRLKKAIERKGGVTVRLTLTKPRKHTFLFTQGQIAKLERAHASGSTYFSIKLTPPQVRANIEHTGGFLWALARRFGPMILKSLASYAGSKIVDKLSKKKEGSGLFLQKNGHCGKVQMVKGGGLYLNPHPRFHGGEGLFEADEGEIKGDGLLLGDNSPFKNVPLLNILL